jgi:hypothetical protein
LLSIHWLTCLLADLLITCRFLAGIEAPFTTVEVGGDKLRIMIDLHSPLPAAAVTEFKAELALRGSLTRDAQGTIRTLEAVQLQMTYTLTQLLEHMEGLKHW